ncbi:DUF799 domain-containing protein [Pseudomonas sp. F1_0610]|uniref:DUF799 domain-containing protein n=1 Tax=Pseudomonas sp. F1_0610 TaxID=3114284 RepID=UPI0039C0CC35
MRLIQILGLISFLALLTGCASQQAEQVDYSAFKNSNPKSILVLPPQNHSPSVEASYGVLSQVSYPLAEGGYYVFPVAVVAQTFRENGLTEAGDIHSISPAKLREIFGADTALYLTVTNYGVSYQIIQSEVRVSVEGTLIDLRTGETLWKGNATASNQEGSDNSGNLTAKLITAVVNQVINTTISDPSIGMANIAANRLLAPHANGGLLYGPRAPESIEQ